MVTKKKKILEGADGKEEEEEEEDQMLVLNNKPLKLTPELRSQTNKLEVANSASTIQIATRPRAATDAALMSASKVKKEPPSLWEELMRMVNHKSSARKSKTKVGYSEKSAIEPIALEIGLPKSSPTTCLLKRKRGEAGTSFELILPDLVSLQADLEAASQLGLRMLTQTDLDLLLNLNPHELIDTFIGRSIQNLQYGLVLAYCFVGEDSGKLANEEKNVVELKQKLLEHEVSLKRLTEEKDECIKQLEEEVKDRYCIGWALARIP
ncbi:hypothetical protein TIFTF001_004021 [Ficus carica]|uniref:Uncharacterized protein n=1 Tax=Ficus carica TaxID=3494 RepID=A0AA87ZH83_FICCA|nr:hypothetical protein TIFTF001_004021 [Ficus carica]